MTDLSHDQDGRQIEREIAIAEAVSNRQIWCRRFLSDDWLTWDADIAVEFLQHIPRLHLQDYGSGIQ